MWVDVREQLFFFFPSKFGICPARRNVQESIILEVTKREKKVESRPRVEKSKKKKEEERGTIEDRPIRKKKSPARNERENGGEVQDFSDADASDGRQDPGGREREGWL